MNPEMEQEAKDYYSRIQRWYSPFKRNRVSLLDMVRNEARGLPRSTMWYQSKVKELAGSKVDVHKLYANEKSNHKMRPQIGRLYAWFYSPKHAATLPYYDRFPLTIPIEFYPDGLLGISMHYLRPNTRIILMDKLIDLASNNFMDARTKLRVSYEILSNAAKYPEVAPTIKRYLYSHVKSRFVLIEPEDWVTAMLLPTEQFQKAAKAQVWSESAKVIRAKRMRPSGTKRPGKRGGFK